MSLRPRFGPAGRPPRFKGPMIKTPKFLHEEGLDAFEYQAVRGVRIKEDAARDLGLMAKKYDVWLTLHAPYFVNLAGAKETIEKSKGRLIESLRAANWMGAHQIVFHPGYYGKLSTKEALNLCIKAMRDIVEMAKSLGITNVYLGPETTGKRSQVGSVEEIITMCEEVDMTRPTIDWAHIHARGVGTIKTKDDYLKILDLIEERLGSDIIKSLHCHYTPVEFTAKGERCHHTMDEVGYGPDFEFFAEIIVEQGLCPVIISESPILDIDSIKMKRIVEEKQKV